MPTALAPSRPMKSLLVAAALALVAALVFMAPAAHAAPAHALHASYVSSDPAANAVVKTAPSVVTIHFAEPVNPQGSAIIVYDSKGHVVSQAAQVETNDLTSMRAPMSGDGSEVYLVYWHTVSATDGDPDVGAFNFFVNTSGASDLAPSVTPPATTTPQASATGVAGWLTALIALIALLVGLAGGVAWARRRSVA